MQTWTDLTLAFAMYLVPLIFVGGSIDLLWPYLTWLGRTIAVMIGTAVLVWWWVS